MKLITIFSLTLAVCCCQTTLLMAQQRVGDFIESRSNNEDQRGAERYLQYYPEHGQFVCVNGKNRYTRALYGGYTDYRVETSDVPIFAEECAVQWKTKRADCLPTIGSLKQTT